QLIAFAVGKQAQTDGVALSSSDEVLWDAIHGHFWYPRYRQYRRRSI
ncbi:NAD-dependent malic enzyme, partial [Salinicola sp. MH3R3-1]